VSHGLRRLRQLLDEPLFLRTPKGVLPTPRAVDLAAPIADILARVQNVMGSIERFDPATSARRFSIGAADATSAVLLPRLIRALYRDAPRIDLGVRHMPKSLLLTHAARFGLRSVKAPLRLRRWPLRAVTPEVRLQDPGVAWLFGAVEGAAKVPRGAAP
jgi:DNA-binding transcriptional LysR family regulator